MRAAQSQVNCTCCLYVCPNLIFGCMQWAQTLNFFIYSLLLERNKFEIRSDRIMVNAVDYTAWCAVYKQISSSRSCSFHWKRINKAIRITVTIGCFLPLAQRLSCASRNLIGREVWNTTNSVSCWYFFAS